MNNCKHPIDKRVNFHDDGYHCTLCTTDVELIRQNNQPKVVYIIGRTMGVEKLNLSAFNAVEGFLNKYGYEAVKQHDLFEDSDQHTLSQAEMMQRRFDAMDQCDMVVLLPDWMECSYARAEQRYASTMAMDVRPYTTFCSSHQLLKGKGKQNINDLRQAVAKKAA